MSESWTVEDRLENTLTRLALHLPDLRHTIPTKGKPAAPRDVRHYRFMLGLLRDCEHMLCEVRGALEAYRACAMTGRDVATDDGSGRIGAIRVGTKTGTRQNAETVSS